MTLIVLNDITKTYRMGATSQTVLHGVSFSVAKGEMIALMGQSGSGKSTIMNIIGLLDKPSSGQYYLQSNDVSTLSDNEMASLRNKTIGFVFQQFFLLPKLSALENVALPLSYYGVQKKEMDAVAMSYLEQVGMSDKSHHRPNELSGGQQQRVAIARALVCSPDIILADEPTGALDSKTSQEVMELFQAIHQNDKRTLIMITHNKEVANACERCVYIKDGLIAVKETA